MNNYFTTLYDDDTSDDDRTIHHMVGQHFASLLGMPLEYYGADSGEHTFNIDGITFKVIENPDDGYRSYLGPIDYSGTHSSLFFKQPIAKVKIVEFSDESPSHDNDVWINQLDQGYRLIDIEDGHVWLQFGTANYDDY